MPAAAHGAQTFTVNRVGAGALPIGSLSFLFAGDYVYELRELPGAQVRRVLRPRRREATRTITPCIGLPTTSHRPER